MSSSSVFVRKVINDPVYGFITITDKVVFDIIEHPFFQRLRRIAQLGHASMVYPGALHTRFHHALGAMHLMSEAIESLRSKGIKISEEEALGVRLAILLHDIGHGPFSHALEHSIAKGVHHEYITTLFMNHLNTEFKGKLDTAISIFNDIYPRRLFHQMVSGQLDMDRLDYLMRDSFYTGVSEGLINTDRILKMLTIHNDELALELKGIYSIEKFIVARRLMYWQVYYHKTVLSAEYMLINILNRARFLIREGKTIEAPESLSYFLNQEVKQADFDNSATPLKKFAMLDDFDMYAALKSWLHHSDNILKELCSSLLNRRLFKVIITTTPPEMEKFNFIKAKLRSEKGYTEEECSYFIGSGEISNSAYNPEKDRITVVDKTGNATDIISHSEILNIAVYAQQVSRFFVYYPKWIE